ELRTFAPWAELLAKVPRVLSEGTLSEPWNGLSSRLRAATTPAAIASATELALHDIDAIEHALDTGPGISADERDEAAPFLTGLRVKIEESKQSCEALEVALTRAAKRSVELADAMDFAFLYDKDRTLFSIGYNLSAGKLDTSYYDLLASEARLASIVAIAKG